MADEFAQQWSLGDHQFNLHGHPDAHYFTGESLVGQIMFCPKNDCNLREVTLHLKGTIVFQAEGRFTKVTMKSILHPTAFFKNLSFLHESINLYEGLAARDEPLVWPFKFDIPTDMPSSTEDDIHPTVKYSLRIDFVTGSISKISYRHPLKILSKVTRQSRLFPPIMIDKEDWKEIAVAGESVFKCALERSLYDSTEKIILNYEIIGNCEKIGQVTAHLIKETKVCFASFNKTLASTDIDTTNIEKNLGEVVVYKGDGLIIPSLQYENDDSSVKVTVMYKVDICYGNRAWPKRISLPLYFTNEVISSMHKNFN